MYSDGVLPESCGTSLDDGVLVVGYGTHGSLLKQFWEAKTRGARHDGPRSSATEYWADIDSDRLSQQATKYSQLHVQQQSQLQQSETAKQKEKMLLYSGRVEYY